MSPLGVLITPHREVQVSKALRSVLPKNATVRLVQLTKMALDGEQVVVYDTGNQFEPHSHVAVVKSGQRAADFALTRLFHRHGGGESYELFNASQFLSADNKNVFIVAFRNIGDGAGTLFVLLTERDGRYEVAWKERTTQGRFKVLRSGKIQVWDSDGGGLCVWCVQQYDVTTFEWKDGGLSRINHFKTKDALDPGPIADTPIAIEK